MPGNAFIPTAYDIFAGVDVDRKSLSVTFTSHQGFLRSLRMPYGVDHLVHYVRKHFAGQRVAFAYEAGPTGYGLYDGLVAQAFPCLVAAPALIPRAPGQRGKTNRLDSRALAEHLRGGQLRSIQVPAPVYRELRHLTQLRDTVMSQVVATKQRSKSWLLCEGLAFPPAPAGRGQWSVRVKAELRQLPCAPTVRFQLDQLLDTLAFAEQPVRQTTRAIRRFCRTEPELARCIPYLLTVSGIGWSAASQLLARIGDWRELQNIRQLAALLGVVPAEHSTGDGAHRGAITRTGDPRLRAKLIQAAWAAIRQDPELRHFFRAVAQRHPPDRGPRSAIGAVARKLTVRLAAVLKQQRPCVLRDGGPSAPLTQEETVPQGTPRRLAEPGAAAP